MKTSNPQNQLNLSVVSLIIPVLLLIGMPILLFNHLSLPLLIGAGIMLAICLAVIVEGRVVSIHRHDIHLIWAIGIVYNLFLLNKLLY